MMSRTTGCCAFPAKETSANWWPPSISGISIFAAQACKGFVLELALGRGELVGMGVAVVEADGLGLALPVGDAPLQAVTQSTAIAAATLARITL